MQLDGPWSRNLGWLATHAPALRERLTAAGGTPRLSLKDGGLSWQRGLTPVPVVTTEVDVEAAVAQAMGHPQVLVAGVADGRIVQALLERTACQVVLWDRDPAFMRPALHLHDWTEPLQQGRLQLAIGADRLDHLGLPVLAHPVLGAGYTHDLAWGPAWPEQRALVVYGTLFVDDLCEALRDAGWAVFLWDISDVDEAELDRTAARVDPQVVFGINHTHGLAEACAALDVPLVEWEIDPSTDTLQPTSAPDAHVFTWRRANVQPLRRAGFQAQALPLATNPARRAPIVLTAAERASYGVPLAYVGSSMVSRGRELYGTFVSWFARLHGGGAPAEAAARELAELVLQVQARSGRDYVVPALLEQAAPGLAQRFAQAGCAHRPDALLGEAAAASYRLRALASVADLGLHVWGDAGWHVLEARGATWRGWAGHFHELTRIYSGGAVHIDVGRLYQLDIVPMRIFDVLSAGGFVLAEHSEDLEACFVIGEEIDAWRSFDELRDKSAYYAAHPDVAARLAARGRARVLRDHTIAARVQWMLERSGVAVAG